MTVPKLPQIATGDHKADAATFNAWLDVNRALLTDKQYARAEILEVSFQQLDGNKNNPAARAKMQELHDADVAKLQALLSGAA